MQKLATINFENPLASLEESIHNAQRQIGANWCVGAELEFYLLDQEVLPSAFPLTSTSYNAKLQQELPHYITELHELLSKNVQSYDDLVPERGEGQYEITIRHHKDVQRVAYELLLARRLISEFADANEKLALFSAKPFANDYGSALHFHISLYDDKGKNLFANTCLEPNETEICYQAIAGLLGSCLEYLPCFIPTAKDLVRLVPGYDAPTHICWGGNNRTTLLRLPVTGEGRRIEHRLASANANPHLALAAIVNGITYGIVNRLTPPSRIYGNAYDKQYQLPKIQ